MENLKEVDDIEWGKSEAVRSVQRKIWSVTVRRLLLRRSNINSSASSNEGNDESLPFALAANALLDSSYSYHDDIDSPFSCLLHVQRETEGTFYKYIYVYIYFFKKTEEEE